MLRRRRLKVVYLLGSLLLLAASLHAPTAYSAPGDPPTGSPAGAVYELPLEQGRSDGAPRGGSGTSGGDVGASGGEAGSLYRTENNFGSSSRVPGLAAAGVGAAALGAAGGNDGPGGAGGAGGNGGGTSGMADDGTAGAGGAVAGSAADAGNASVSASVVLLGVIALLAAAVGALSRRARGRAVG